MSLADTATGTGTGVLPLRKSTVSFNLPDGNAKNGVSNSNSNSNTSLQLPRLRTNSDDSMDEPFLEQESRGSISGYIPAPEAEPVSRKSEIVSRKSVTASEFRKGIKKGISNMKAGIKLLDEETMSGNVHIKESGASKPRYFPFSCHIYRLYKVASLHMCVLPYKYPCAHGCDLPCTYSNDRPHYCRFLGHCLGRMVKYWKCCPN